MFKGLTKVVLEDVEKLWEGKDTRLEARRKASREIVKKISESETEKESHLDKEERVRKARTELREEYEDSGGNYEKLRQNTSEILKELKVILHLAELQLWKLGNII